MIRQFAKPCGPDPAQLGFALDSKALAPSLLPYRIVLTVICGRARSDVGLHRVQTSFLCLRDV